MNDVSELGAIWIVVPVWLRKARVHDATVLRIRRLNTRGRRTAFEEKLLRDMEK